MSRSCSVRAWDRHGQPIDETVHGLKAGTYQHEVDHLNGKLIIDFLSRLKRDMIVRRFKKQAKAEETAWADGGLPTGGRYARHLHGYA